MVKYLAITIKGTLTSKLYGCGDYESLRRLLPSNIQISPFRYELDGKQRLHVHGVLSYTGKSPYLKHYFGPGWHVHTSPDPTQAWFNYIEKDKCLSSAYLEYKQTLHSFRQAGSLFNYDI